MFTPYFLLTAKDVGRRGRRGYKRLRAFGFKQEFAELAPAVIFHQGIFFAAAAHNAVFVGYDGHGIKHLFACFAAQAARELRGVKSHREACSAAVASPVISITISSCASTCGVPASKKQTAAKAYVFM